MIRHLAELFALLLCFAVGVGVLAVGGVALLWIWSPTAYEEEEAREDEYRRVEEAGVAIAYLQSNDSLSMRRLEATDGDLRRAVRRDIAKVLVANRPYIPRPYNWATREPMVWSDAKG